MTVEFEPSDNPMTRWQAMTTFCFITAAVGAAGTVAGVVIIFSIAAFFISTTDGSGVAALLILSLPVVLLLYVVVSILLTRRVDSIRQIRLKWLRIVLWPVLIGLFGVLTDKASQDWTDPFIAYPFAILAALAVVAIYNRRSAAVLSTTAAVITGLTFVLPSAV